MAPFLVPRTISGTRLCRNDLSPFLTTPTPVYTIFHEVNICVVNINIFSNIPCRSLVLWADAVQPVVSGHEISAGVSNDRDIELLQSSKDVLSKAILI
jgi:hypothetical protein